MDFDVDLGALSSFRHTENEVRFAPSRLLSLTLVTLSTASVLRLWDRYLAELGWLVAGFTASPTRETKSSITVLPTASASVALGSSELPLSSFPSANQ